MCSPSPTVDACLNDLMYEFALFGFNSFVGQTKESKKISGRKPASGNNHPSGCRNKYDKLSIYSK